MRPIERISIIMRIMFSVKPISHVRRFSIPIYPINEFVGRTYPITFQSRYDIMYYWMQNPDQRLGQVLTNLDLIPRHISNSIYNIEEDDWLISNGYCNVEDVKFWTSRLDENDNRLDTPRKILLKDLDINHIRNIITFFENRSSVSRIDGKYLEYFDERIHDDIHAAN